MLPKLKCSNVQPINACARTWACAAAALLLPVLALAQGAPTTRTPSELPRVQLLPDLIVESAGETSRNVYYGKVKNLGPGASAPAPLTCGARIQKPGTSLWRSPHRELLVHALKVGETANYGCDFNTGADRLQPGESIVSAYFIVNSGATKAPKIAEVSTKNNLLLVKAGTKFNY